MDNSTAALLQDYLCSRDEAVRNEIVLKNLGLVRSCALSLRNMYIKFGDVDDVVNEGVIALMEAIESYDPDKGAKFETYATLKIRGAIIDFVRGQDWIPRSVRKFARDLDNANSSLYNQYNRMPTTAELSEYMEMSEEKLLKCMAEASSMVTLSFEELLYEDNFENHPASAGEATDSAVLREECRRVIAEAIDSLKEKEKQVITLYYFKNMKYSDIAKVLGISESRVCQINTKATLTLKTLLEPYIKGGDQS
ncbi:MAG: FliA/WhiG family RNA polymerase sigma factor [Ruminococcaceae bacterium]|nr:FliA/WhiG family RNA polymerase sigma factor [Oscillospiraceae bacterium]